MARILVLEDSEESFALLRSALSDKHSLVHVRAVAEAMRLFDSNFDLALVDIGLPDGDGYQFCDWIRNTKQSRSIPILFVSANSSVESRITSFSVGGDDFISKPFNIVELKARIDAKLRRSETMTNQTQSLEVDGVGIDHRTQRAKICVDSKNIDLDLTPIEFKILNLFLNDPDKVFQRDEILNKIWGQDIYVYPRSVDTHVSKLRSKLGQKSSHIRSVHGIGYKFSSNVDSESTPNANQL